MSKLKIFLWFGIPFVIFGLWIGGIINHGYKGITNLYPITLDIIKDWKELK